VDIFNNRYSMKGFDGISMMRRNAIAAGDLKAFTADKVHFHTFTARVIRSFQFANLDNKM
jgi:hypothetical protein